MSDTYTQVRIHIIFSTKNRKPFISEIHREEVERYMAGICSALNQKLLAIYCMPDHTHILVGLRPDITISEFVQKLKANSSRFINQKEWLQSDFAWQKGFGAFSYAKSQTKTVIDYILNQKEHHKKKSFEDEYVGFLEKFEVDYNPKYVFG